MLDLEDFTCRSSPKPHLAGLTPDMEGLVSTWSPIIPDSSTQVGSHFLSEKGQGETWRALFSSPVPAVGLLCQSAAALPTPPL